MNKKAGPYLGRLTNQNTNTIRIPTQGILSHQISFSSLSKTSFCFSTKLLNIAFFFRTFCVSPAISCAQLCVCLPIRSRLLFWFLATLFCSKLVLTVLLLDTVLPLLGWDGGRTRQMSSGPREMDMVWVVQSVRVNWCVVQAKVHESISVLDGQCL